MGEFDIVVQNPLPRIVWFTFGSSPSHTSSGIQEVDLGWGPAMVWHLGEFYALRLEPGATVGLHNWHTGILPSEEFAFTFASEIRLGGVPVATWFGKAGLTTDGEGGEVDEGFAYRRRVSPDRETTAKLDLDVLCSDIRTLDTVRAGEGE